jgi:hypothetical protein
MDIDEIEKEIAHQIALRERFQEQLRESELTMAKMGDYAPNYVKSNINSLKKDIEKVNKKIEELRHQKEIVEKSTTSGNAVSGDPSLTPVFRLLSAEEIFVRNRRLQNRANLGESSRAYPNKPMDSTSSDASPLFVTEKKMFVWGIGRLLLGIINTALIIIFTSAIYLIFFLFDELVLNEISESFKGVVKQSSFTSFLLSGLKYWSLLTIAAAFLIQTIRTLLLQWSEAIQEILTLSHWKAK